MPEHQWTRIEIDDTSDCETCTKRDAGALEFLARVKCRLLEGIVCPECGREFNLFVEETTDA